MSKIIVTSKPERGFRRAGYQFTRAGVELDISKLAKGVLEELQAEPNLVIAEVVEDKKTSGGKKAEGDLCYRVLKPFEYQGAKIEPTVGDDNAPVSIQLGTEEAEKLAAEGFISTAEGDVSLPPDAKKAKPAKAGAK